MLSTACTSLPGLLKILPPPRTLNLEHSFATSAQGEITKAARTPWDTLSCPSFSGTKLSIEHPSTTANPSNVQELRQSKGHMFFPALSSRFFADRRSNEAHELYLSSRHSCRHSLFKAKRGCIRDTKAIPKGTVHYLYNSCNKAQSFVPKGSYFEQTSIRSLKTRFALLS